MLDFSESLSKVVKKARMNKSLSQEALAEQLSIDKRTIIRIENGKGNPNMRTVFSLVRALEINPIEIFYPELGSGEDISDAVRVMLFPCNRKDRDMVLEIVRDMVITINRHREQEG